MLLNSSGRRDGRFALVECGRLEVESGRSRSAYGFFTFHLPPSTCLRVPYYGFCWGLVEDNFLFYLLTNQLNEIGRCIYLHQMFLVFFARYSSLFFCVHLISWYYKIFIVSGSKIFSFYFSTPCFHSFFTLFLFFWRFFISFTTLRRSSSEDGRKHIHRKIHIQPSTPISLLISF